MLVKMLVKYGNVTSLPGGKSEISLKSSAGENLRNYCVYSVMEFRLKLRVSIVRRIIQRVLNYCNDFNLIS